MAFETHIRLMKEKLKVEFELKQEQIACFRSVYEGKDTVAVLPTGFGKSIIFQGLPFLLSARDNVPLEDTKYKSLIISPLNSIMIDQINQLNQAGINACALDYHCNAFTNTGSDDSDIDDNGGIVGASVKIKDMMKCNLIYAHPEALLSTEDGRNFMTKLKKEVKVIAIDEAHIITEWGDEFRQDFKRIGTDILAFFPTTPVILCSATAPPSVVRELVKTMNLKEPTIVELSPDRRNIKYFKFQTPTWQERQEHFDNLLHNMCKQLMHDRTGYPLTILYSDLREIGYAFKVFDTILGEKQYIGDNVPENRIFAQFHASYTEDMKRHIVKEICKVDSKIRIVFATVALGMGLNAPGIRCIIHYKPPNSIPRYCQETGRAGRDGEKSEAILFYNMQDVRKNRPGIKHDIIKYCSTNDCLRAHILDSFGHSVPDNVDTETCCAVCSSGKIPEFLLLDSLH